MAQVDGGAPLLRGDPTQLRQVIHNLVQNALDAECWPAWTLAWCWPRSLTACPTVQPAFCA
ncbi:MAG: hypothetical protein U1F53_12250 [Burkholderiaceae bacterium]